MKTFCFKLYHSQHNKKLHRQINAAGLIYNHCIALHKRYYRLFKKYLDKNTLQKHLVKLKNQEKFSYIRELGSQAVQDITDRIDRGYNLFWRNREHKLRASPPNFKRVYIYIVSDVSAEEVIGRTGKSVGYDFGLKIFLTSSDGNDIISPLFFAGSFKIIKNKSKNLSRKHEGSNNRRRAKFELARAYRKIFNQRKDFHFKTARRICEGYAIVCLEDLNLKGMQKRYGRKISDLGFYDFVQILKYEAKKFGTQIVFIDRWYASSQICNNCGYKNHELKDVRIREWNCPKCNKHHDRDRNAAINIHRVGASTLRGDKIRPDYPYGQSGVCC